MDLTSAAHPEHVHGGLTVACIASYQYGLSRLAGDPSGSSELRTELSEVLCSFVQLRSAEVRGTVAELVALKLPKDRAYAAARVLYHHTQLTSMMCQLRDNFLHKLVSCASVGSGAATNVTLVRSRAVKCVGAAVEANPALLGHPRVCECIGVALQDDSALVKEAALDILDKAMARSNLTDVKKASEKDEKVEHVGAETRGEEKNGLHDGYFDMLAVGAADSGLLVKKRAMRILWDRFVCTRDSQHRLDAELAVLSQQADHNQQVKSLVARCFTSLWFSTASPLLGADVSQHVAAADLSEVELRQRQATPLAANLSALVLRCLAASRRVRPPFKADWPVVGLLSAIAASSDTAVATSFYAWLPHYLHALQGLILGRVELGTDGYDADLHSYLLATHCLLTAADSSRVPHAHAVRLLPLLEPALAPRGGAGD